MTDSADQALLVTEVFPSQTGGSGRWFWKIFRRLPREQVTHEYNFTNTCVVPNRVRGSKYLQPH